MTLMQAKNTFSDKAASELQARFPALWASKKFYGRPVFVEQSSAMILDPTGGLCTNLYKQGDAVTAMKTANEQVLAVHQRTLANGSSPWENTLREQIPMWQEGRIPRQQWRSVAGTHPQSAKNGSSALALAADRALHLQSSGVPT